MHEFNDGFEIQKYLAQSQAKQNSLRVEEIGRAIEISTVPMDDELIEQCALVSWSDAYGSLKWHKGFNSFI